MAFICDVIIVPVVTHVQIRQTCPLWERARIFHIFILSSSNFDKGSILWKFWFINKVICRNVKHLQTWKSYLRKSDAIIEAPNQMAASLCTLHAGHYCCHMPTYCWKGIVKSVGPLGTQSNGIRLKIQIFHLKKIHLKMPSCQFCQASVCYPVSWTYCSEEAHDWLCAL